MGDSTRPAAGRFEARTKRPETAAPRLRPRVRVAPARLDELHLVEGGEAKAH